MVLKKHLCLFLFLALAVLLVLAGCTRDQQDMCRKSGKGVYFGLAVHGLPETPEKLEMMAQETGLPVSMVNFFLQWPKDPGRNNFPRQSFSAIHQAGAMACLTWEPMYRKNGGRQMVPAEKIVNGKYDRYIDRFAKQIRELGYPVIIRFAHEMNIQRYHWGGEVAQYGPGSPRRYRNMFRYVVSRFRETGAQNAFFAFCPNAESLPNPEHDPRADWNRATNYYPGSDYVHVLGMDGYNWGKTRTIQEHGWESSWRSFEAIFSSVYEELRRIDPEKPVFVFETASVGQKGQDRGRWTKEAFAAADRWGLQGIFWFQAHKKTDWRLQSDADCNYCAAVRRRFFSPMPLFEKKDTGS